MQVHNFNKLKKWTFKEAFGEYTELFNIKNDTDLVLTKKKCISNQDIFYIIKVYTELNIEEIKKK